jgi:hypothetical protein
MAALYFRIASLAINQAKIKIASEEDPGHLEDTKRGIAYYPHNCPLQAESSSRFAATPFFYRILLHTSGEFEDPVLYEVKHMDSTFRH